MLRSVSKRQEAHFEPHPINVTCCRTVAYEYYGTGHSRVYGQLETARD